MFSSLARARYDVFTQRIMADLDSLKTPCECAPAASSASAATAAPAAAGAAASETALASRCRCGAGLRAGHWVDISELTDYEAACRIRELGALAVSGGLDSGLVLTSQVWTA